MIRARTRSDLSRQAEIRCYGRRVRTFLRSKRTKNTDFGLRYHSPSHPLRYTSRESNDLARMLAQNPTSHSQAFRQFCILVSFVSLSVASPFSFVLLSPLVPSFLLRFLPFLAPKPQGHFRFCSLLLQPISHRRRCRAASGARRRERSGTRRAETGSRFPTTTTRTRSDKQRWSLD